MFLFQKGKRDGAIVEERVNNLKRSKQAQVNSVISAKKERGQGSPAMDSKWVNKMLRIYLQHYSTF